MTCELCRKAEGADILGEGVLCNDCLALLVRCSREDRAPDGPVDPVGFVLLLLNTARRHLIYFDGPTWLQSKLQSLIHDATILEVSEK